MLRCSLLHPDTLAIINALRYIHKVMTEQETSEMVHELFALQLERILLSVVHEKGLVPEVFEFCHKHLYSVYLYAISESKAILENMEIRMFFERPFGRIE